MVLQPQNGAGESRRRDAEGATSPESLRQTDRTARLPLKRAGPAGSPKGEAGTVPAKLSGARTEGDGRVPAALAARARPARPEDAAPFASTTGIAGSSLTCRGPP